MTTADDRTTRPGDDPAGERTGDRAGDPTGERASAGHPFGPDFGPLVDEVRRFANAVGEKAQEVGAQEFAAAALGSLTSLAELPGTLRGKHPEVYGHLSAAGGELLAAYRAAVSGHERRWSSRDEARSEHIDLDTPEGPFAKE
ncbi:DUF5304 family protein [Kitasatospora sp. NPDC057223]|uniref:DUF5304 family protein n=1 Tax=Kitasatospora sp. NPDC057223 TaxID=3346055 RepID=UPI0036402389